MTKTWPLQDAKARFSELFTRVCEEGPQRVTRHGKDAIILIAEADYKNLSGQDCSFVDYLLSGPKAELDIPRPADFGRALDL
jgi:antitoxin Phd